MCVSELWYENQSCHISVIWEFRLTKYQQSKTINSSLCHCHRVIEIQTQIGVIFALIRIYFSLSSFTMSKLLETNTPQVPTKHDVCLM